MCDMGREVGDGPYARNDQRTQTKVCQKYRGRTVKKAGYVQSLKIPLFSDYKLADNCSIYKNNNAIHKRYELAYNIL